MNIVTRDIKECRRQIAGSNSGVTHRKRLAHRRHRREVNSRLNQLKHEVNAAAGLEEIRVDLAPSSKHMLTGWDIS